MLKFTMLFCSLCLGSSKGRIFIQGTFHIAESFCTKWDNFYWVAGGSKQNLGVHRLPQTQQVWAFTLLLTWMAEQQHWGRNTVLQAGSGAGGLRAGSPLPPPPRTQHGWVWVEGSGWGPKVKGKLQAGSSGIQPGPPVLSGGALGTLCSE